MLNGFMDIIEGVGKLAKGALDEFERVERSKADKARAEQPPPSRDRLINELRAELSARGSRIARQEIIIQEIIDDKAHLKRELDQERSTRETIQARVEQMSEPSTTKHIYDADHKRKVESLKAALVDAQAQQERDVAEIEKLRAAVRISSRNETLKAAWEKLNKRPLPASSASFARRLNEFAKAVGLDNSTSATQKIPAKGKRR